MFCWSAALLSEAPRTEGGPWRRGTELQIPAVQAGLSLGRRPWAGRQSLRRSVLLFLVLRFLLGALQPCLSVSEPGQGVGSWGCPAIPLSPSSFPPLFFQCRVEGWLWTGLAYWWDAFTFDSWQWVQTLSRWSWERHPVPPHGLRRDANRGCSQGTPPWHVTWHISFLPAAGNQPHLRRVSLFFVVVVELWDGLGWKGPQKSRNANPPANHYIRMGRASSKLALHTSRGRVSALPWASTFLPSQWINYPWHLIWISYFTLKVSHLSYRYLPV